MRSSAACLNPTLRRPPAAASGDLPWLPPPPPPKSPTLSAADSPPISNAAFRRAIAAPSATPAHLLSLYSAAARQPGFRHDYPTYAALIPFLVLRRRFLAAALLLSRMPRDGLHPGPSILLSLLPAISSLPSSSAVRLLLASPLTDRSFSSLIPSLLVAGRLDIAQSLLNSDLTFPVRVRHYINLVKSYLEQGSIDSATALLDSMASKGSIPDVCCYGSLIRGLPLDAAFMLAEQMRRVGREPDVIVWNILVHKCVQAGELARAEEVVMEMEMRGAGGDAGTYNTLIAGLCDYCYVEDGFRIFGRMIDRGVELDVITFSTMISRLGKEGRVLECDALFGRMMRMGVVADAVCYRILLGVYCRNGMVGEAGMAIRAMKASRFFDDEEAISRIADECKSGNEDGLSLTN